MPKELRLILAAVQFFTRLPVPAQVGHGAEQLAQAARHLPLVGLLVGAIAAAVLWLSAQLLPLPLAVLLSMAAGLLATGAFHEDGLSDFADGMGGGHTKEKALAIMKDPRVGSYGAIALVLALLLKFEALRALCETGSLVLAAAALVAAHAVSRLMAASIMLTHDYVRDDDSARARPAAQRMGGAGFAIALLTGLAALALPGAAGAGAAALLSAAGAALAMRMYLAWRLRKRLGGYTGDCLGAVQQLSELAFYLGLLAAL